MTETTQQPEKSNKKLALGLGIGLPILAGILIGGYFLYKNIMSKKEAQKEVIDETILTDEIVIPDSTYFVIVGAYYEETNALKHAEKEDLEKMRLSEMGTFRVKHSEFPTREIAFEHSQQLRAEGKEGAWVLAIALE